MARTILVADDHEDIRALVCMTLEAEDVRILEAGSGEQAVAVASDQQPDLVLLDVSMPGGIDGVEACRRLRADPRTAGAKVIMLTAAARDQDRQRALEAGANGYFVKPFSPLDLLNRIYSEFGR